MKIGETILKLREEKKMSQEEFAEYFHVTRQTISNWIDRLSRVGYIHIDKNTEWNGIL